MFLSGLFLAGALQASPAVVDASLAPSRAPVAVPFSRAPRMAGQRPASECRQRATLASKDSDASAMPLNRMPWAMGERAVMRMIDGCPVRTPIVRRVPKP
ncbi:hypothetical protein [Caulobacter sp.]|uniref:hypothetical protein n=1 Tax=Caulobacter sp. TaxID=78 RepID=UPI002B46A93C|nr:hypothetical protein [Caulobacter sp.]HJV41205.1 hypothetical protein [Caulobacter sp.]